MQRYYSSRIIIKLTLCAITFISGCDLNSDLDRQEAERLLLAENQHPSEIVKGVLSFEKTQFRRRDGLDKYASQVNHTRVAAASVLHKPWKDGFGHTWDWYHLVVKPTAMGEPFVRGKEKNGGFRGSHKYLPVLIYTINFGEVTGIAFQNLEKTTALVEYTEIYTPTPFTALYEKTDDGQPKKSSATRSAILKLYDDGWRVLESEYNRLIDKEDRTVPP